MSRGNALIIDDEPDVAAYQGRVLSDHGWQVRIASGGDQGLALALEETPDVILLDLMMPGGRGGLNTFMELRRNPSLASIPVVFVTAYPEPDPDDLYNFLGRQERLRPDAYLEKPVDPETLLATVDKVMVEHDQPATTTQ
jgi:twitching motility two-component system response regulator PilH